MRNEILLPIETLRPFNARFMPASRPRSASGRPHRKSPSATDRSRWWSHRPPRARPRDSSQQPESKLSVRLFIRKSPTCITRRYQSSWGSSVTPSRPPWPPCFRRLANSSYREASRRESRSLRLRGKITFPAPVVPAGKRWRRLRGPPRCRAVFPPWPSVWR